MGITTKPMLISQCDTSAKCATEWIQSEKYLACCVFVMLFQFKLIIHQLDGGTDNRVCKYLVKFWVDIRVNLFSFAEIIFIFL